MVNATVSHEMRNPINSIHSQNINLQEIIQLIEKLKDGKIFNKKAILK